MLQNDDVEITGRRHENVRITNSLLHGHHLEALHASLQSTDGIALANKHTGSSTTKSEGTAFANIAIAGNESTLASDHHIRGTHDAVSQRMTAATHIVELGLGHTIVHIDGKEKQLSLA